MGLVLLRSGVKNSYVWGLDFLRFGVSFLTFDGEGLLRLGVSNSYVWCLVVLRLRVRDSYV